MKVSVRKKVAAVFVGLILVLIGVIFSTLDPTSSIANVSMKSRLLGKWSFPDRFGRTVFWEFGDSGVLNRHASDDTTDVDQWEWWVRDSVLTVRLPMKLSERIHHSAALALHGRKLNDARQEIRLSEVAEGRWRMSWIESDGREKSVIMTRVLDDEQRVVNP